MFVLSALVYPLVLAALAIGAGLAVDRAAGGGLAGPLLAPVGVAALIAVAELATYVPGVAPATPYLLGALGLAGLAVARARAREGARRWRAHRWELVLPLVAFAVALAPVLLAGRATFSAYMVLTDSALHMIGADYLIHHGQSYAHLDLLNSYGQYINNYYAMNYPTGADALLGGSAILLGVPVIWAFQPFTAFVLATMSGPALLLARRIGLDGALAATAALIATVPALVYAYSLIGSIKEIVSLPLIMTMGALVADARWLRGRPRVGLPFALVAAAGVSALGVAFGVWAAAAVAVLAGIAILDADLLRGSPVRILALTGIGIAVVALCSWPTWHHASGSLEVAQAVATTPNRGNLVSPLSPTQVFGTWLTGNYEFAPLGAALGVTDALIALTAVAALAGAWHVVRTRRYALAAWLGVMVALCVGLTRSGAVWAHAKVLVLSSPVFMLLAFAGVAALGAAGRRRVAIALAAAIAGGVLISDVVQYHDTDLAPTARYDELASINSRFSGRGPALFTDFDEYALYELRGLDIGGPDFMYPPIGLSGIDASHGGQVNLGHGHEAALLRYPLIITRRDPLAVRPPSAYGLLWQGTSYQVWGRRPGATAPRARFASRGISPVRCARVRAAAAAAHGGALVAASPAPAVVVDLEKARVPASWISAAPWLELRTAGSLQASVRIPHAGRWEIWLQGELMPTVDVRIDGRAVGRVGGAVGGDLVVPDTAAPIAVALSAGSHRLTIIRGGLRLSPGAGGSSVLSGVFLTPAGAGERESLWTVPAARWRELCGHRLLWVEAGRAARSGTRRAPASVLRA